MSVRTATEKLKVIAPTVDILINNAGVMGLPFRTLSVDGSEMHRATNFLGPFLFTELVIQPSLTENRSIRVVNVTNAGFVLTPIRFSDLNFEGSAPVPEDEQVRMDVAKAMGMAEILPPRPEEYVPLLAYSHSGTAIVLFTQELARRYGDRGLISIAAAPGVVETQLRRHMPGNFRNPNMFYKTPSQGASSFLVAALDPKLRERNGCYVDDCQVVNDIAEYASSPVAAAKLWNVAKKFTNSG